MSIAELGERFNIVRLSREIVRNAFARDVDQGLSTNPKYLPCIYFYDEKGSLLFEDICKLPEYYLTRAESEILKDRSDEIASFFPEQPAIVELGSGSSIKTRYLLEAFLRRHGQACYTPIDISHEILRESSFDLLNTYPGLEITAVAATYEEGLKQIGRLNGQQKLVLWLGSSIGNFVPDEAELFMRHLRDTLQPSDSLLIGIDLQKEKTILERAYDDSRGITAAFNLNLLGRINRELEADFDLKKFEHLAFYNEQKKRVEIYIRSKIRQVVHIGQLDVTVTFDAGEKIHTEFSHKYSLEDIGKLARKTGFIHKEQWFDSKNWFSLNLFVAE